MIILHKIIFTILISLLITTFPTFSQDDSNQNSNITLSDLPKDMWNEIFGWINNEYNTEYWASDNKKQANNKKQAKSRFYAIKNIIPLTRVNKKLRHFSKAKIKEYYEKAQQELKPLGDIDRVLYDAINSWDSDFVKVCQMLGADINTTKLTKGETLLTDAIENQNYSRVKDLLKYGADPIFPNDRGEVPIDLAYDISPHMARWLKDCGGDPDKNYHRGEDRVWKTHWDGYGRRYAYVLLAKKMQAQAQAQKNKESFFGQSEEVEKQTKNNSKSSFKHRILSLFRNRPVVLFATGITIGAFITWLLIKRNQNKKQKNKIENELERIREFNAVFSQEFERRRAHSRKKKLAVI